MDIWDDHARLAVQYYVSARFAVQSRFLPICGNLMHHAFERLLKCGLIKAGAVPAGQDLDAYLRKEYGHSLPKLWNAFMDCHKSEDWAASDRLVLELDEWEEIRYPKQGVAMLLCAGGAMAPPGGPALLPGVRKQFQMNVQDFDSLFRSLWATISINSELFESVVRFGGTVTTSVYENENISMVYA